MMRGVGLLVLLLFSAAACSGSDAPDATTVIAAPTAPPTSVPPPSSAATSVPTTVVTTSTFSAGSLSLGLEVVAGGFTAPVLVTHLPGDSRIFVVDLPGRIWVVDGSEVSIFLDISDLVSFGGEQGLLGMAFHPSEPGRFYVNYTDVDGDTVIAEFQVSADPNRASVSSRRSVLTVEQPAGNHNGGMVAFGPDGNLWIGMGDGGGANDGFGNGQRGDTLLGSMLRIAVGASLDPYGVPAGNVFPAPEVWAVGLRNPWRFAFDGDDLWIADVGQGEFEEINRVSASAVGLNFGWPIYEGSSCFGDSDACTDEGFVFPVSEYTHADGCSITGGYIYRGARIPTLDGHYFFSDFCSGFLRSINPDGRVVDWTEQTGSVRALGFGTDAAGELYVAAADGSVYRLVSE